MPDTKILTSLREHLIEELFFGDPQARIEPDDNLFDLGLDSLGVNRLVVFAERKLGARIPDTDIIASNFQDLQALTALVERRRG